MGLLVVNGANCTCTMGQAPAPIRITSNQTVLADNMPAGTISDAAPSNVGPFGMCVSLANPAVASATAAALGVLTPQPCTPVPAGTWIPTKPAILIGGQPCLADDCKLMCSYAGTISIVAAGQFKTTLN